MQSCLAMLAIMTQQFLQLTNHVLTIMAGSWIAILLLFLLEALQVLAKIPISQMSKDICDSDLTHLKMVVDILSINPDWISRKIQEIPFFLASDQLPEEVNYLNTMNWEESKEACLEASFLTQNKKVHSKRTLLLGKGARKRQTNCLQVLCPRFMSSVRYQSPGPKVPESIFQLCSPSKGVSLHVSSAWTRRKSCITRRKVSAIRSLPSKLISGGISSLICQLNKDCLNEFTLQSWIIYFIMSSNIFSYIRLRNGGENKENSVV